MLLKKLNKPAFMALIFAFMALTFLLDVGVQPRSTSEAAPLLSTAACFPTADLNYIRVGSSLLGDNFYGDYLIDFDGDGRTDVFRIDPSTFDYQFSSQAKDPWQTIRQDIFPFDSLRFGDMEGDGITDILFHIASGWYYLSDGLGTAVPLIELTIPLDDLRIGQFDNDPRSDIFYQAPNGDWLFSSGGTEPLTPLGPNSTIPVDKYRFADLDGNGKTDIFRVAFDDSWYVSYDGVTNWVPILNTLSEPVEQLRFGHFDNQPGADVLFEFGNKWFYSSSGVGLPKIATNATVTLDQLRLGDFNGNGLSDIFSIAPNERWQVDFDTQGDPQFLLPTVDTPAGLLTCLSGSVAPGQNSWFADISLDGKKVVFTSNSDLLAEGNVIGYDIWLYDFPTQTLKRITTSLNPTDLNFYAKFSADGKKIVFEGNADLLSQGNVTGNEIWLYDIQSEILKRITTASGPDRQSRNPRLDATGRHIVFNSDSDFLGQGIPVNDLEVWLYDTVTENYTRITILSDSDRRASFPVISQDGSKIVFHSDSDFLNQGLPLDQYELWLYDVSSSGNLTRLTTSTSGTQSFTPEFDGEGGRIVFTSDSDFNGEGIPPGQYALWQIDIASGGLTRLTDGQANRFTGQASFSDDGRTIVFVSDADMLGEGLPRNQYEIWRLILSTAQIERLTVSPGGASYYPSVSGNGRLVTLYSNIDFSGHGDVDGLDVWLLNTNPLPPPPPTGDFNLYLPSVIK